MKLLAFALLFGLGACSSVSIPGLARLATLSPLETDPTNIAVALSLPDGVVLRPGTAQINLGASTDGRAKSTEATYILAPSPGTDGSTVYRIAAADLDAFRAQQKLINGWKGADPDGTSGSFGVSLEGCATGGGPRRDATVSIAMRTSADDSFFPLVKNAPWKDVLGYAELDTLGPC